MLQVTAYSVQFPPPRVKKTIAFLESQKEPCLVWKTGDRQCYQLITRFILLGLSRLLPLRSTNKGLSASSFTAHKLLAPTLCCGSFIYIAQAQLVSLQIASEPWVLVAYYLKSISLYQSVCKRQYQQAEAIDVKGSITCVRVNVLLKSLEDRSVTVQSFLAQVLYDVSNFSEALSAA